MVFRREAYIERLVSDREWQEKVVGRIIDQGGGLRAQDNEVSKLGKFCEVCFICRFAWNMRQKNYLKMFSGFSLSLVPLLILGLEILSFDLWIYFGIFDEA